MNLAAYRETRGLTQEEAALELGLKSKGYFSRLEQGQDSVPIRLALQMQVWSRGVLRARELVSDEDRQLMDAAAAAEACAA